MSGSSSALNIITESNSISFSIGSLIFGIDGNSQKSSTSEDTRINIAIADLIISDGLSFNLYQKKHSRRYWSWQRMSPRHISFLTERLHRKSYLMLFMNRTQKVI